MKTIKIEDYRDIPNNYTGIIELSAGTKIWLKNGKWHRADGRPAVEWFDGEAEYWINDRPVSKEAAELYAMIFNKEE